MTENFRTKSGTLDKRRTYYVPRLHFEGACNSLHISDRHGVNLGKAQTWKGLRKKMLEAGFSEIRTACHYPDGRWIEQTLFTK